MNQKSNPMISPDDALMLFIDLQSRLFNLVKDMPVSGLRRNVVALAEAAISAAPTWFMG
jgi:hypothetical protein